MWKKFFGVFGAPITEYLDAGCVDFFPELF